MKKIVTIGGANGQSELLRYLRTYSDIELSAVVTMMDSGGSTGRLREEFGILPPGDIRRVMAVLSEQEDLWDMWNTVGEDGHKIGNIIIRDAFLSHESAEAAIASLQKEYQVIGNVLPVTIDNTHLHARYSNGDEVHSEGAICEYKMRPQDQIEEIWLDPHAETTNAVREAILDADAIVLSMGDVYTSLIPNLLVAGVTDAIAESSATVMYICNRVARENETVGFSSADMIETVESYLGDASIDIAFIDDSSTPYPPDSAIIQYEQSEISIDELVGNFAHDEKPSLLSGKKLAATIIEHL